MNFEKINFWKITKFSRAPVIRAIWRSCPSDYSDIRIKQTKISQKMLDENNKSIIHFCHKYELTLLIKKKNLPFRDKKCKIILMIIMYIIFYVRGFHPLGIEPKHY